ncbi:hypothetical protein CDAR_521291 [Caerostris darwini]|uniref:Uncharacterized protein n=1 Tax=Caerostris darwini TaxID=1538125 RepID=A0AAV4VAG0_9ARAC|nr:hypothetical protein CDAR_521291 [Caerostris darwini]
MSLNNEKAKNKFMKRGFKVTQINIAQHIKDKRVARGENRHFRNECLPFNKKCNRKRSRRNEHKNVIQHSKTQEQIYERGFKAMEINISQYIKDKRVARGKNRHFRKECLPFNKKSPSLTQSEVDEMSSQISEFGEKKISGVIVLSLSMSLLIERGLNKDFLE